MDSAASTARRAVKTASRMLPPARGEIVILCYHRIGGGTDSEIDLPTPEFERQMRHLVKNHPVVSLSEACRRLVAGDRGPAIVLTFDDGTIEFGRNAVPVLNDLGLPATLYLTTDPVVKGTWPNGIEAPDWKQLREAVETSLIVIGNHTHTHRLMNGLRPDEATDELDTATELIEQHLQRPVEHFAYPKAVGPDAAIASLIEERFVSAAVAGSRPNQVDNTDLHRLRRTPIQRSDDIQSFAAKVNGGGWLEAGIRSVIHRVSYRHAER